jgi:hypothetical protein
VCAECKAEDLENEGREEIESALAYLDALTAIEISADANAGGCYSPDLLDRWGAMGEDNHRQRLLIKALILVGAAAGRRSVYNHLDIARNLWRSPRNAVVGARLIQGWQPDEAGMLVNHRRGGYPNHVRGVFLRTGRAQYDDTKGAIPADHGPSEQAPVVPLSLGRHQLVCSRANPRSTDLGPTGKGLEPSS